MYVTPLLVFQTGSRYSLVLPKTIIVNGNDNITSESHLTDKENDPRREVRPVARRSIWQGLEVRSCLLISPPRVLFPKLLPGNREEVIYYFFKKSLSFCSYVSYLQSLKISPSAPNAISRGGSKACMAKAMQHISWMNSLRRQKSTSGGNEIFGLTFMARITSWKTKRWHHLVTNLGREALTSIHQGWGEGHRERAHG